MKSLLDSISPTSRDLHRLQLGRKMRQLFERVVDFQKRKFPNQPFSAKAKHLMGEVEEWMADPHDRKEAADCFILVLACADKQGITLEQLIEAAHAKMDENNLRRWSAPDADGVYHHLEEAR